MAETSEFFDAVVKRDMFLGENRCVVCGFTEDPDFLEIGYIIAPGDNQTVS